MFLALPVGRTISDADGGKGSRVLSSFDEPDCEVLLGVGEARPLGVGDERPLGLPILEACVL